MPRSPAPIKRPARGAKTKGLLKAQDVNYNLSDELNSDDDRKTENKANPVALEQKFKQTSSKNTGVIQARKKALYLEARKNAKELVKSSVTMVEDMQANLAEIKTQQTGYQKYYDDYHPPRTSLQEAYDSLMTLYPLMLNDLGAQRAEKLERASTMLKDNAPRRQDALKEFSKNARQRLEKVKRLEKDAQDAADLIKHVKNLLHG